MNIEHMLILLGVAGILYLLRQMVHDLLKVVCIDCHDRVPRWNSRVFYSDTTNTKGKLVKVYCCRGFCARRLRDKGYEEVNP